MHNSILVILVAVLRICDHSNIWMMGRIHPLLRRISCWAGVDPVRLLEKLCEHDAELGWAFITLIYGHIWDSESMSMKDGTMEFTVFPHKDGVLAHHLEVGPFLYTFRLPSIPGPF